MRTTTASGNQPEGIARVYRGVHSELMRGLSPDDRPREKLARHGVAELGDNELLDVVLASG
jgi:hypothetical protein